MVSLGSGDPQLLTIKGLKALQTADVICVPTKSEDGSFKRSLTHKIIQQLFKEHKFEKPLVPVYSPMRFDPEDWKAEADVIMKAFKTYQKVAFVTLGDSAIYSSVYYILGFIKQTDASLYHDSEVIPGITSFSDASARVKKPLCLGDSALEIKPLLDYEVPKTTIYMRPKIGLEGSSIPQNGEMLTFENLNFKDEKIHPKKIDKVKKYMTLFIDFFVRGI